MIWAILTEKSHTVKFSVYRVYLNRKKLSVCHFNPKNQSEKSESFLSPHQKTSSKANQTQLTRAKVRPRVCFDRIGWHFGCAAPRVLQARKNPRLGPLSSYLFTFLTTLAHTLQFGWAFGWLHFRWRMLTLWVRASAWRKGNFIQINSVDVLKFLWCLGLCSLSWVVEIYNHFSVVSLKILIIFKF